MVVVPWLKTGGIITWTDEIKSRLPFNVTVVPDTILLANSCKIGSKGDERRKYKDE
jgi:hypothetical protein